MSDREYSLWTKILFATVAWALLMMFIPPTVIISPITVEITGSVIGFILAIGFTELIKLKEKRNRAKKIKDDIREEISEITELVEKDETMISFDIWEMAVSTGDVGLLDSDTRKDFGEFYRYVRYNHWYRETFRQYFGPENTQHAREVHRKLTDENREVIKLTGRKILENLESRSSESLGIQDSNNATTDKRKGS